MEVSCSRIDSRQGAKTQREPRRARRARRDEPRNSFNHRWTQMHADGQGAGRGLRPRRYAPLLERWETSRVSSAPRTVSHLSRTRLWSSLTLSLYITDGSQILRVARLARRRFFDRARALAGPPKLAQDPAKRRRKVRPQAFLISCICVLSVEIRWDTWLRRRAGGPGTARRVDRVGSDAPVRGRNIATARGRSPDRRPRRLRSA